MSILQAQFDSSGLTVAFSAFNLIFLSLLVLNMKYKLFLAISLPIFLGGCFGGPTPEMLARAERLESQGLSKEEKRAIVFGIMMRTMPQKLDSLKIWPVQREGFTSALSPNGSKFSYVAVEYKYTGPPKGLLEVAFTFSAAPEVKSMCLVVQFINGTVSGQVPGGYGRCSGDDAEDMMPVLHDIEAEFLAKARANKPVGGPAPKL